MSQVIHASLKSLHILAVAFGTERLPLLVPRIRWAFVQVRVCAPSVARGVFVRGP